MRTRLWLLAVCACPGKSYPQVAVAVTTTVEASGLLARLEPGFERDTKLRARVVVAASGHALALLEHGDVEVTLTHDPDREQELVKRLGLSRRPVMRNDFVLVGPNGDPAGSRSQSIHQAMRSIARSGHTFVSRGDESGTHRCEQRLWEATGAQPNLVETGQGMGETLMVANELQAYTLVDSATLQVFQPRIDLQELVRGGPELDNVYSVLWRTERGQQFADWLSGEQAREMMTPLFRPIR